MAMRGYIGVRASGLIHRGADLVVRILAAFERIRGRRDAAGCHQLDVRCAAAQLFPDRVPHRVHAIRNYGEAVHMAAAAMIARTKVTVAAGLADGAAAVE